MPTIAEKDAFSLIIQDRAQKQNIDHIEAITDYCEETGLEVEVAATLTNPTLRSIIEIEARKKRFLQKSSQLPV
jgi:Phage late-transcription coactivator